jgi:hypothetical protein
MDGNCFLAHEDAEPVTPAGAGFLSAPDEKLLQKVGSVFKCFVVYTQHFLYYSE